MIYSQFKEFNLSDFKLPDIKRQQLDLNLNLDFEQGSQNLHSEGFDAVKSNDLDFSNYNRLGYSLYRNTEKLQTEQAYLIYLSPNWTSDKYGSSKSTIFHFYSGFYGISNYRRYFNNQLFFEPDLIISGSYHNYITKSDPQNTTDKAINYNTSVKIPILFGKGRIERVQDARLAIYILEDLQKNGKLNRVPDNNEILEFASFIAVLKNERYFDYRLKRIEEIEKIDSFMQARNLINKADAVYFTSVLDNWEYAEGPVRESGNRLSGGIVPEISIYRSYNNSESADPDVETDLITTLGGSSVVFQFESDKPLNLYWQRNWSATLAYSYIKDWRNEKIVNIKYNQNFQSLNGTVEYSLGYYPNSRTHINVSPVLDALMKITDYSQLSIIDREKYYIIKPYITLDMLYYFSPQLSLTAHYNIGYAYSNSDDIYDADDSQYLKLNTFNQHLTVSFNYSFF
jgi:hypothetical protein